MLGSESSSSTKDPPTVFLRDVQGNILKQLDLARSRSQSIELGRTTKFPFRRSAQFDNGAFDCPAMSSRHAIIFYRGGKVVLQALSWWTWLNGQHVDVWDERLRTGPVLSDGDQLDFGISIRDKKGKVLHPRMTVVVGILWPGTAEASENQFRTSQGSGSSMPNLSGQPESMAAGQPENSDPASDVQQQDTCHAFMGQRQHCADPKRIVVAIDFGTSHSGYAFGKEGLYEALGNPSMTPHIASLIHVCDTWPGATMRYRKTHSATLFDYDGQPVAHGDLALAKYLELQDNAIQQHALVRRIKLLLADDYSYNDPFLNKHHLEPSQIIADFLTYFKCDVEELLQRAGYKLGSGECSINWVVTIPAMWTVSARATMEAAAKSCGLFENGGHVSFCLEPEAALLNCVVTTNLIKHGDCVLVVDMGGGTVDLAAFQVCHDVDGSTWHGLKFDMITPSDGCTSGATLFDDAFYEFFFRLIGVDAQVDAIDPESKLYLLNGWERAKRNFDPDSDVPLWIELDLKLQRKISEGKVAELVAQDRYDLIRGQVSVLPGDIIACFDKVYPSILAVTLRMMSNAQRASKRINKLLCVGGFAEMRHMQQRIRDDLAAFPNLDVVFPPDSGASVVQGALFYGISPESVQSQR